MSVDLIKIFGLIESLAKAYKEANADGKITVEDIPKFLPVLKDLTRAVDKAQGLSVTVGTFDAQKFGDVRDSLRRIGSIFGG